MREGGGWSVDSWVDRLVGRQDRGFLGQIMIVVLLAGFELNFCFECCISI